MTLSASLLGYGAGTLALLALAGEFGWRIWQQTLFRKDAAKLTNDAKKVDRATIRDSRIATGLRVAFIISVFAGVVSLGATSMADKKEDAMIKRVLALEGNLSGLDQRVTMLEKKPPSSGVADAVLKDVEALRLVVNELKPTVDSLVKHVTAVDEHLRKIEARLKQLEQRPQPGN